MFLPSKAFHLVVEASRSNGVMSPEQGGICDDRCVFTRACAGRCTAWCLRGVGQLFGFDVTTNWQACGWHLRNSCVENIRGLNGTAWVRRCTRTPMSPRHAWADPCHSLGCSAYGTALVAETLRCICCRGVIEVESGWRYGYHALDGDDSLLDRYVSDCAVSIVHKTES